MKTSFALLVALGVCYLYILEDIGKFITYNLDVYKRSLQASETDLESDEMHDLRLLRTPADTLIEEHVANFTEEEMNLFMKQVVGFEDVITGSKFPRINHDELYYNNFYRRVIFDLLARRDLPPRMRKQFPPPMETKRKF